MLKLTIFGLLTMIFASGVSAKTLPSSQPAPFPIPETALKAEGDVELADRLVGGCQMVALKQEASAIELAVQNCSDFSKNIMARFVFNRFAHVSCRTDQVYMGKIQGKVLLLVLNPEKNSIEVLDILSADKYSEMTRIALVPQS